MSSGENIVELVPYGVWVARAPAGEFVYANRTFADIMGMAPRADVEAGQCSEPYGIYDRDGRLYPEDRLPFARALREKTTVVVDDLVIHRRDGGRVYVRAVARPIKDRDGNIAMVAIVFSDVTAEMQATEGQALAQSQSQLATLVSHAPIAFFSIDLDGKITFSEGSGPDAMGVKSGELVGKSVFELYRDHPTIPGFLRRGLAGESLVYTAEVPGAVFETCLGPVRDRAGAITGAIGVSTDVTESAKARARSVQAERLVAIATVAASVAHELNNPLAHTLETLRLANDELQELARILIVDDNVSLARVMVVALKQAGHQAEAVFSGKAAIELLCSGRPFDLVFCDLMMTDISGMDVFNALKARAPGSERSIVFMTGGAFTERARQFLATNSNELLEKPFFAIDEVARILKARQG